MKIEAWLQEAKLDKPELTNFINKLERFITDSTFNVEKFEKAIETGLKKKELEIIKSYTKEKDA